MCLSVNLSESIEPCKPPIDTHTLQASHWHTHTLQASHWHTHTHSSASGSNTAMLSDKFMLTLGVLFEWLLSSSNRSIQHQTWKGTRVITMRLMSSTTKVVCVRTLGCDAELAGSAWAWQLPAFYQALCRGQWQFSCLKLLFNGCGLVVTCNNWSRSGMFNYDGKACKEKKTKKKRKNTHRTQRRVEGVARLTVSTVSLSVQGRQAIETKKYMAIWCYQAPTSTPLPIWRLTRTSNYRLYMWGP